MEVTEVRAVHKRDLDEVLARYGLLEPLDRGEIECAICGCTIDRNNIGTIYKYGGQTRACCNRTDCLEKVFRQIGIIKDRV